MKTVTYQEYENDLNAFIKKHSKKSDLHIWTSPFIDGEYRKEYMYEDGASFYEINNHSYIEEATFTLHGITVKANVKMIKHEYFSTDLPESKIYYERV